MIGGNFSSGQFTNWVLDLESLKWETLHSKKNKDFIPISRDEHTVTLVEDFLVAFGGFQDGERTNTIDIYSLKQH